MSAAGCVGGGRKGSEQPGWDMSAAQVDSTTCAGCRCYLPFLLLLLKMPVPLSGTCSMVLATSLSMATGYSIINGIASAAETLCGQAYGAKNYPAIHDTLQVLAAVLFDNNLACIITCSIRSGSIKCSTTCSTRSSRSSRRQQQLACGGLCRIGGWVVGASRWWGQQLPSHMHTPTPPHATFPSLQRALLICGLTCIPISAAWLNAEWILTHLGQPVDIASGAAKWVPF